MTSIKLQWLSIASEIKTDLIPPLYRENDPSRFPVEFRSACSAWKINPHGLGLTGPSGIGKTRCIFWMLGRMIDDPALFDKFLKSVPGGCDASEFLNKSHFPRVKAINDGFFSKLVVEASFMEKVDFRAILASFYAAPIVFLDDIGQSKLTERVCAELYQLVEYRTSHLLPILFTSNFSGDQLAARFTDLTRGTAVVRRLAEFCNIISSKRK